MTRSSRLVSTTSAKALIQQTEPWLSCDDCFDRMDEYVERRLADPAYVDAVMATHLAACSACAEEAESLYALTQRG